jgi:D-3-phosphoglycerate dehydrogenase / 2-oxoglutarate reductase
MKPRIMVSAPYLLPVMDRYRGLFLEEGLEVIEPKVSERLSEQELLPLVGQIEGAICGDDRFSRKVFEAAPRLRVVSKWGTGIDSIDRTAAADFGIRVCNTPNAFTIPVADSVFAAMLSFARRTPWMDHAMKAGEWHKMPGRSLSECTLGIIGVGSIGREIARRAAAFGMTILGTDPRDVPEELVARTGIRIVPMEQLLVEADFVSVNCDLNAGSFLLLSDRQFSLMKPTAVVINTARGPIVDEKALIRALRAGRIAGAALDVFEVEPLPPNSPLLKMDNVLLSPHNSNSSPAAWEKVHRSTIDNLLKGLREVKR